MRRGAYRNAESDAGYVSSATLETSLLVVSVRLPIPVAVGNETCLLVRESARVTTPCRHSFARRQVHIEVSLVAIRYSATHLLRIWKVRLVGWLVWANSKEDRHSFFG